MTTLNTAAAQKAFAHQMEQFKTIQNHPYRQWFHFEPPAGWCNDPNGVGFYNGQYHLFYQNMPYNADPDNYSMYWGHAASANLFHWQHLPPAICPADEYDKGGCWSGSSFMAEGQVMAMYTAIDPRCGNRQVQCLARSQDLLNFEKDDANPLLSEMPSGTNDIDFRDPKVWKHEDTWYMLLGSATHDGRARALLYKSEDLRHWQYFNDLVESAGELGPIAECPDFFPLGDRYVLLLSPKLYQRRKVIYLVGDFDHKVGKLYWDTLGEVDWGMDYYAPQTLLDDKGRRIAFAWQNSWDWMPWCDGSYYTTPFGWCGGMALPRQLSLNEKGLLASHPVEELKELRGAQNTLENIALRESEAFSFSAGDNIHCEWKLRLDLTRTTARQVDLQLRSNGENYILITLDLEKGELRFDRTHSLYHIPYVRSCPLKSAMSDTLELHVFMDTASIELFTDEYTTSMSNTAYLPPDATGLSITPRGGGCMVQALQSWPMQKSE